ncbi:MAG TPA: hypothetical protein VD793_08160, partial [Gemmatimonadales bacterium]|nr:hypothetical protein [Gemmatimonadales bacterium]
MMQTKRGPALERLAEYFQIRKTRPGVLARRLLKTPAPDEDILVEHLIRERRRNTRMDGSIGGSLVRTAWTIWELLQLDCPPDHSGVVRTVGYLIPRQDQPGRLWGEGCSPQRHERKACQHHVSGFFSAGPADQPLAPLRFPAGADVTDEADARFAASCFALRSVLRAGEDRRATVRRHLESLLNLEGLWASAGDWPTDLALFALGALGVAPLDLRERVPAALDAVIGRQGKDGAWPGASAFHAVDMLLSVPRVEARRAVLRTAPVLWESLAEEGPGESDESEERALITLRAL